MHENHFPLFLLFLKRQNPNYLIVGTFLDLHSSKIKRNARNPASGESKLWPSCFPFPSNP